MKKNIKKTEELGLEKFKKTYLTLGVILMIFGALLIFFPVIGTFAFELLLGISLLIIGIFEIIIGFILKIWKGAIFIILTGIFSLLAGLILLFYPTFGVVSLTLFIGLLMIIQGIFEIGKSFHLKQKFWKRLICIDGIFCSALGILVLIGWPSDSKWIIGLLLGISIFFSGLTIMGLAKTVKKEHIILNKQKRKNG